MTTPAFCWFARPGENEELRFSLRTVHRFFPDAPLYIVGDKPDWVTGVAFLQGNRHGAKKLNVWDNLVLLADWDDVPDDIVIMNDDMFIVQPIRTIPVLYRGTLVDHIARLGDRDDWWTRSLQHTQRLLGPYALSYELHTPFPAKRSQLRESLAIDPGDDPPQWRTLYGNQWHTNPTIAKDVKITRAVKQVPHGPFISTTDQTFRFVRYMLLQIVPGPSPYEADNGEYGPW